MISTCPSSTGGFLSKTSTNMDLDTINAPPPPHLPYSTYGSNSNNQLVPSMASGNNTGWSSTYNTFPYANCGTTTPAGPVAVPGTGGQYATTPTMVLYPQLYSTVNQNQIHLHLHGASSDKLEQYLGAAVDNSLALTTLNRVEVGVPGGGDASFEQDISETGNATTMDSVTERTDPTTGPENPTTESVWRPY